MFDKILDLVKQTVNNSVAGNAIVPDEKKAQTVDTMTHEVTNGLKQNFTLGNIPELMNLFKKTSPVESNPITNNIVSNVTSSLIQKVGLPQSVANVLSTSVVPMVMKAISGKVNDPNEKEFNAESLVKTLSGEGDNGILSKIGKIFG